MLAKNITDEALVLSRVDFGEKDRIITVLTPNHGKLRAIVKSARSPKSKLAGGIELFAENHLVFVRGRGDLFTVISANMKNYFGSIPKEVDRSMYGYECLKYVNKLTPDAAGGEYYRFLLEVLSALNNIDLPLLQIRIWFGLKLLELTGSTPNFITLKDGSVVPKDFKYHFDFENQCFFVAVNGKFSPDHLKLLRYFTGRDSFKPVSNCSEDILKPSSGLIDLLLKHYFQD